MARKPANPTPDSDDIEERTVAEHGANGAATAVVDDTLSTRSASSFKDGTKHRKPYSVNITIEGVSKILFHRFDCGEYDKGNDPSLKGTKERKTDNVESYVYRVPEGLKGVGNLGIPARNIKSMLTSTSDGAGKFFKDPRSPRKSMCDLLKAAIFVTPEIADLGLKDWDFIDRSRQVIQTNAIVRSRPGLNEGWRLTFTANIIQPNLLPVNVCRDLFDQAGQFCGLCDSRPDYGRFRVTNWEVIDAIDARG